MRKMKRFLAILLTASMLLSSETFSVLATEVETASSEVIEATEVAEVTETAEIVETTEAVENTETVDTTEVTEVIEVIETTENNEVPEIVESIDVTKIIESTEIAKETAEEQPKGGYRPLPEESNIPVVQHNLFVNEVPQYFAGELEAKYVTSYLPDVKDQSPYGTCWAFSSISLGELDLLQHSMGSQDLSELQLAYFTYNSVVDPLGGTAGDSNGLVAGHTYDLFDAGGNLMFAAHVLANWMGMTEESKAPYESAETVSANGLSSELAYDDIVHLKNAYFLNIKENPEIVKAMIKEYGGVGISYCANNFDYSTMSYPGYNEENNCHYDSGNIDGSNHAVTIVGWDDNFAKEKFNVDDQPAGNGAWLVRNSWGSVDDEQNIYGYFWLSYYDPSIEDAAYVFDVTVEGQEDYYDNNYQYDGSMRTSAYGLSGSMTTANVFTAHSGSEYENLKAVSFSTTLVANQSYKIEVYKGLTSATNPTSGELAAAKAGNCIYAGIYTVELDEPVELEPGELFSVVVTMYAAPNSEGAYLDYEISQTSADWYDITASACSGQSYIYWGYYWKDFGAEKNGNFRIKAFTDNAIPVTGVSIASGNVELAVGEKVTLEASVAPEDANNKAVIWSSTDESVATVDEDGNVTAIGRGDAVITATTVDGGYTASIMVSVTSKLISISLDKENVSLALNQDTTLTVSYNPTDTYTDRTVTWKSSDESIVTVNANGKLSAVGLGKTTITANVAGKEATCTVSVIPPQTVASAVMKADGSVNITWTEVEECTKYYVYRRVAGSNSYTMAAVLESGTTSYIDRGCSAGTKYYYYVESEYSDGSGYTAKSQSAEVGTRQEISQSWLIYSETQDYTGIEFQPTVLVKNGDDVFIEGTDYEISYKCNTIGDVKTCDVTITGIGEYIGSQTVTITEKKATIQSNMVSQIPEMIFNGGELKPNPKITFNGEQLVKDEDYTLKYANNTEIGIGVVTITGIGHFEGEVTSCFVIRTKTMEEEFVASISEPEYTGAPVEPNVILQYNGVTLQKNVDYRISFSNNVEVGQATATIKGRGNYVGTIKVPFEIKGAKLPRLKSEEGLQVYIAGNNSDETYSVLYTGEPIEPEVTLIRADGEQLVVGKDYEVSYSDNVLPGEATITITGIGNYAGVLEETFEIRRHDIGGAIVSAGKNLTVLYTPKGQEPLPKVVYDNKRLTEGKDFEAVYYLLDGFGNRVNGTELEKVTDAGNYELELRGIGTFTGTKVHAATITVKARALNSGKVVVENPYARIDVDSGEVTAQYSLMFGGELLVEDRDYTVEEKPSANQEFVTYVFTGMGNYSGTLTQKFKLIDGDIIVFSEGIYKIAEINNQPYTGKRIEPEISVVKEGNEPGDEPEYLVKGVDYTVSFKHNLNAGPATVIVTGIGKCVGTMQTTFEIVPMEITEENVSLEASSLYYNGENQKPAVVIETEDGILLEEGKDYTLSYSTESKDVGTYQVEVLFPEKGNYSGTVTKTYEITALPVKELQIVIADKPYTGTAILPTIDDMVISLNGEELTEAKKAGLQVSGARDNVEVSDAAFVTISGAGNFTGQQEVTFSIVEKPISDTSLTIHVNGSEIVTNATGYKSEWTGNPIEPPVEIWNGALKLVEGEDYTVTYRYNTEIGTARIFISGKGNYTGNRTLYFEITGMILAEENGYTVSVAADDCVYDGTKKQPEVTVAKDGTTLIKGTDYHVIYMNHVAAGTAKVVVSGAGRYTGSVTKEFTIAPKTLADATVVKVSDIAKQRYSGERITPDVTIEIDGVKLVKGEDYTTTVLNGVDAGIATVVVSGIGNYGGVLAEKQFEIYHTTITYVMNGGVNSANNPTYYTAKDSFVLADPEPRDEYNFAGWYSDAKCTKRVYGVKAGTNGDLTFYAKWTGKQVFGVDVSKWQGDSINWQKVKAAGQEFVMLRVSYGSSKDSMFDKNYAGAKAAGIKVGAYCYNTALTVDAAVKHAHEVMGMLEGTELEYPVCLDMEDPSVGALDNVTRTNIVYAFKNVVESYGYDFILYANYDWLNNKFVDERLEPLDLWIARWRQGENETLQEAFAKGHGYKGSGTVRIWQFTDRGYVDGIGVVDQDYCYEDYVKKQ